MINILHFPFFNWMTSFNKNDINRTRRGIQRESYLNITMLFKFHRVYRDSISLKDDKPQQKCQVIDSYKNVEN